MEISSFYTSVTKIMIMCLFFILGHFLPLYHPKVQRTKIFLKIKKHGKYHFTQVYQKL